MKSGIRWGFITSLLGLLVLFWSLNAAAATALVGVSLFNLSPPTVNIKTGDVVYWEEDDEDFGPYAISGPWGVLATPGGVQFPTPGTFQYTASSVFGGGTWPGTVIVSAGTPNSPPVVTITNPTNNAVFTAPATFAFEADASDADPDDLWDVEFWVNDEMVDDVFAPPYATTVTNLPAGTYTLMAIAWDFALATTTNSITITVIDSSAITLTVSAQSAGSFEFNATGLTAGKTNVLQTSTNPASPFNWVSVSTNVADSSSAASFTRPIAPGQHFFRVLQLP